MNVVLRGTIKGLGGHQLNQLAFIYWAMEIKSVPSFLLLKWEEVILSLKVKQAFPECTPNLTETEKAQQACPRGTKEFFTPTCKK